MDHVLPPAAGSGAGGEYSPLPPPMSSLLQPGSPCPRALVVAEYASRRHAIETRLRLLHGFQVEAYTDPTTAMAMRRGSYQRVMVDMFPLRGGAVELLECAISEMHADAYALSKVGDSYGPLTMKNIETFKRAIKFHVFTSIEATPNHRSNNSATHTVSTTTTTFSSSGRRETSREMRQQSEMKIQEVEQDGEHNEEEHKPAKKESKKVRLVWTEELKKKFENVYNKLSPRDAVPTKILKLMNDPTLTRENIASHLQDEQLQKFRNLKHGEAHTIHKNNSRTNHHTSAEGSFLPHNISQQVPHMMMQVQSRENFQNIFMIEKAHVNTNISNLHESHIGLSYSDQSFSK